MANLIPQVIFALTVLEEVESGIVHTYLGWQTIHLTQADGGGEIQQITAPWHLDIFSGHLVCAHTLTGGGIPDLRSTFCGAGTVAVKEDGAERGDCCLAAPGTSELFGTIVEFSSTAKCTSV